MTYKYCIYSFLASTLLLGHLNAEEEDEDYDPIKFPTRQTFFSNAEFLYWKVAEGALDYAIRMEEPAAQPLVFASGDYKKARYDWAPAFRLGFAYYRAPHLWEMLWQYTWFFSNGSNETHIPGGANEFLTATWNELTSPPLERATSEITLHYHLGDYLVARVFDPNPHLRLRLYGGLTSALIKQNWKVSYYNFIDAHDDLKNKWRFFGGGLRLGLNADWFQGGCIYITGKTSIASLVGSYRNHAFQTTGPDSTPIRNATYKDPRLVFHAQFILGPSYQRSFGTCKCWDLEIFGGYEFNTWFNLQEVYRSSLSSPAAFKETNLETGMLGFHGLTARITVYY